MNSPRRRGGAEMGNSPDVVVGFPGNHTATRSTSRSWPTRRRAMNEAALIKVGVITDQTGPLSFLGMANANIARLVIDDINAAGGLLGRRIELVVEDSATDDN